jgi:ferrous iron transport protein A
MSMTEGANTPRPLSVLPVGRRGVVHALNGGRDFCSRIANLGFTAGAAITVVQNYGHGPMLVSLRGTLVALGRTEAGKVVVKATDGSG